MSILGTCPECLHHTDGMCDLRPRICLNYDHFERRPMVTLTRDDFEKLYISRAAYDELNAKVSALQTRVKELLQQANATYDPYRRALNELRNLVSMKNDALDSYDEFYGCAASLCGLPEDALPGSETDAIILQRLAEHNEVARLTELQQAASEFIGYIKAGNNAKAHLQMLFLEVLINEESKNGAKK